MRYKKYDLFIILFIILFMIISISCIYSASTYLPDYLGNLSLKQTLYYIIGFITIWLIVKLNNDKIFKIINILYILGIFSLFMLLIFGSSINGSKCWFVIPYIGSIQPSEFIKYILVIKLSIDCHIFFIKESNIKSELLFILKELIIISIPAILTFLEPDTGAVFMYLISSFVIFMVAPFRKRWKITLFLLIAFLFFLFYYFYFYNKDLFMNILGNEMYYRIDRIINWQNGKGMQLENSLISIGSSNIWGHGFNKTPLYFPESGTDFIFSVLTSNFGLVGSLAVIFITLLFDIYLLYNAYKIDNIKDKLIIISSISCLFYQQIQNIGMTLGILPITGITLPFISYGGSSLISNMIMVSIIMNIITKNKNKNIIIIKSNN